MPFSEISFMGTMLAQPPIPAFHAIPPVLRNRPTNMAVAPHSFLSATHQWTQSTRFGQCPFGFRTTYTVRVAEQSSSLIGDETPTEIKTELYQALEGMFFSTPASKITLLWRIWWKFWSKNWIGLPLIFILGINRGIFGVPSAKKAEIEALVKQLESQNPTPDPILNLEKVYSFFFFCSSCLEIGSYDFFLKVFNSFYNWKMGGCWKLVYSTITILGSKRTKLGLRDFISLGDFLQNINVAEVQRFFYQIPIQMLHFTKL